MHTQVDIRTVPTPTNGRVLVSSPRGDGPAPLLVGFHGYGENAERHLDTLRTISETEHWRIASVQALHRFYERRTGDVVASWMTKQDRDLAIDDNLTYVRNVVTTLRRPNTIESTMPLVYVGFSQGVAMAYRAALRGGYRCHGLLILAGDVPPELHDIPAADWPPILLGCGTHDEWYTSAKLNTDTAILESQHVSFKTVVFDGGHVWHPDFLDAAANFLAEIRKGVHTGSPT
ncbi:MAG: hypothetical protein VYE68_05180 [Acidobacteriota bacterium]|nr:hypothetical protein [Acidobacteriota bacterium]